MSKIKFDYEKFTTIHGNSSYYSDMSPEFLDMCEKIGDRHFTSALDGTGYCFSFRKSFGKRRVSFSISCYKNGEIVFAVNKKKTIPLELFYIINAIFMNAIFQMTAYGLIKEDIDAE